MSRQAATRQPQGQPGVHDMCKFMTAADSIVYLFFAHLSPFTAAVQGLALTCSLETQCKKQIIVIHRPTVGRRCIGGTSWSSSQHK